jgi:hypothetical protein
MFGIGLLELLIIAAIFLGLAGIVVVALVLAPKQK